MITRTAIGILTACFPSSSHVKLPELKSLHHLKRREGHREGVRRHGSIELENRRLDHHVDTRRRLHHCPVNGIRVPHIGHDSPHRQWCLLQVGNGDGRQVQAIKPTAHQVTSGRRTVSAVEELEVVFGIDVINKPGISGFVRIDVTTAKVERIGELTRNSLCFYGKPYALV
ncbi:hypothetical protein MUK42_01073 [Musa troglodytarum]|uniref:Uncharacterized protein n=1 Tax=Musa troglodytarum TaxID=320322 RepID=A0A9E7JU77_9LILI|nr:hypothetical protein MUK42_01073 [Musa troglodytarum]